MERSCSDDAKCRADARAERGAVVRADGCAENGSDAEMGCRNEVQKWIAETVQNLPLIGCTEKMAPMQIGLQMSVQIHMQSFVQKNEKSS